ncbi:hypothetical protein ACFO3E_02795 [Sphingobium tyrosinilyticum]|uniref:Uncharacterized protein n=1 Tax=Sphingobium tyrosinilyticum TaxID=2715436 RepID=A0ABV9EWR5_9SPHN
MAERPPAASTPCDATFRLTGKKKGWRGFVFEDVRRWFFEKGRGRTCSSRSGV